MITCNPLFILNRFDNAAEFPQKEPALIVILNRIDLKLIN